MIQIHNSLSNVLEPFVPLKDREVKMYVCGPTVYGLLHIGNGRTFLFWDVVRRYLAYRGYQVTYVQNFTDVDDKIILRAQEEGLTAQALAENYVVAYFEDMEALGVLPADRHPRVTDTMPGIISHIAGLIAKGLAYAIEGDVYFRVRRFADYGKLSRRAFEDLAAGARVEIDPRKEDPLDFALWKGAKPGEPAWESPWGPGRPGWHIECSAMVRETLGDTIDIHAGGMDLKFPHHENEIAQSEGLTDKPFARYWMHTGFLNMEAEKMSKSLGNIKTIRDVVGAYGAQAVRVFLLGTHYRQELDFSDEAIRGAWEGWKRLGKTLEAWESRLELTSAPEIQAAIEAARKAFEAAMDQDFNTPRALAHFHGTASRLKDLAKAHPGLEAGFGHVVAELRLQAAVLGLELSAAQSEPPALEAGLSADLLSLLVTVRQEAKAQKNWALADVVRNRLKELGIQLLDHKDGTTTWEIQPGELVSP